MTLTFLQKIALGISGLTALGVGALILVAPNTFYAGYGISLGSDPSLLSELRAPAAGLAALGMLMLAGIALSTFSHAAMIAALTVFLAFPAGRLVGLVIDGVPSDKVVAALVFELAVAALCLIAFRNRLKPNASRYGTPRVTAS